MANTIVANLGTINTISASKKGGYGTIYQTSSTSNQTSLYYSGNSDGTLLLFPFLAIQSMINSSSFITSVGNTATIDLGVSSGTLTANLNNTTVTAGSYTLADITIDAQGRITAASNGSAGTGTVTSVAVASTDLSVSGSPITTSGTITLNVNTHAITYAKIQQASTVTLLGNPTGGTANVQEITLGTGLGFVGSTLVNTSPSSGGTVTSVQLTAGTGISLSGTNPITTSGNITVTNSAPDQTVVLNSGTGISVTGTYPNFTITNTSPSSGGTVTSFSSGNLSPLFTTSVATSTTTPALSFALSNSAANTWYGNNTGGSTTPSFNSAGSLTETTSSVLTITGSNTLLSGTTIAVTKSDATHNGYLSSSDWTTFSNKQATISVTTPITLSGASIGIVNQGTTTTVLHGNASGNASFSSVVGADIATNTITYNKIQQATTVTLLGNPTGGTANISEITLGTGLSFSGSVLNAAGVTPSGSAGGDLTGTYPNPTIKSSVNLSGNPTTTTQAALTNNTTIATTAYVDSANTMVLVQTINVSTQSTIDVFPSGGGFSSTYSRYIIYFSNLVPTTNNVGASCIIGTGGTPTWQSGAGSYSYSNLFWLSSNNNVPTPSVSNSATSIVIAGGALGNTSGATLDGVVLINNPSQTSVNHTIDISMNIFTTNSSVGTDKSIIGATYLSTTAVTGFRFTLTSGTWSSGLVKVYGIK